MTSRNIVRRACRRMMDKQDRGIGRLQRGWLKRMRGSEWASDAPATSALVDAGHRGARFPAISRAVLGIVMGLLALTVGAALVRAAELNGLVRRAVDGDTLIVGIAGSDVRVRLADIDAPEIQGQCPAEIALAQRAKARLGALTEGYWVALTLDVSRPRDAHGRMLATATVGRSWLDPRVPVGTLMIAEGLARPWTGRRMPWC